ncbi:hypothetical protein [Actinopolymorpha pittospori]
MKLTKLTDDDAAVLTVETLGFDAEIIGLTSVEGIAASLRRAASFMCPTSPGRIVDAVLGAIQPIHPGGLTRDDIADMLDQLIASGDLLELRHDSGRTTRLLYLAPPSYIERSPGTYLLMGVRPFGAPLIGDELAAGIEYEGPTRVLALDTADPDKELHERELQAVPKERWVSSPASEAPADLIGRHRARLDVAGEAGHLDDLVLLDPASKVTYYRGRWRTPAAGDTGDFVARRPQAYGADLWCLIRFEAGVAQRLIEFPVDSPVVPGRDEAWRYQAAVDALRGAPQRFRVSTTARGDVTLDFLLPLPGFAERYLQLVGLPLGKTQGALFSYRVPSAAAAEVATFLTDMLWMSQEEATSGV